ncbi:MAG: hypothetical protein K0Q78_2669 [Cellvibrio sp.]|nr:hypothetical protein [Cellvibrio sp.]
MRSLLVIIVLLAQMAAADVYKTVDKDGNIKYTDNPQTGKAEKVELREINTVPGAQSEALPQSVPVDSFAAVNLTPTLQQGHLLVYFMNGELLEETTMNNIIVKDVPRGTHTLVVEVIDQNGQSLGTSAPTIVNVIRPNIKNNAPPKPTPH